MIFISCLVNGVARGRLGNWSSMEQCSKWVHWIESSNDGASASRSRFSLFDADRSSSVETFNQKHNVSVWFSFFDMAEILQREEKEDDKTWHTRVSINNQYVLVASCCSQACRERKERKRRVDFFLKVTLTSDRRMEWIHEWNPIVSMKVVWKQPRCPSRKELERKKRLLSSGISYSQHRRTSEDPRRDSIDTPDIRSSKRSEWERRGNLGVLSDRLVHRWWYSLDPNVVVEY